jgi:hypothetical protein
MEATPFAAEEVAGSSVWASSPAAAASEIAGGCTSSGSSDVGGDSARIMRSGGGPSGIERLVGIGMAETDTGMVGSPTELAISSLVGAATEPETAAMGGGIRSMMF